MYSDLAWSGFALFFHLLDKLHLARFHRWDPTQKAFIKNPKPSPFVYLISNATIFMQFICIPVIIAVTNVVNPHAFPLRSTDAALLFLLFMAGMHSVPIYYQQLTAREAFAQSFNQFIKLESFLRKNQLIPISRGSKKSKLDIPGIVMNIMSPMFFALPFASAVIVYLNLDPLYFIVKHENMVSWWGIVLRVCLSFVSILELALTLGTTHFGFITITLHCHWVLTSLKTYRKPTRVANYKAANGEFTTGKSSRRHKMIKAASILRSKDPESTKEFDRFDDIQLYLIISYLFKVIRLYIDTSAIFTIGPGFWIDVTCNYAAIKLYEETDIVLYLYFCLIAVLAPCIIVGELPQAARSYDDSYELLKHWKCTKRKTYRRKYIIGLNTVGFSIGSFFIIKRGTFGTFMEELLNYTISSVLTL